MKKALRARESASKVREHKDLWRIMRDSQNGKYKEAHQYQLQRIVKNKSIHNSPEVHQEHRPDPDARRFKKTRTALPKEWI